MTMQKEQPLKQPKHSRENVRITLNIAWPSIVESFFVAFAGLVDSLMVSSLGSYAVAAVGLTTQPKFVGLSVFFAANVAEEDLADDGASNEKVAQVQKFAGEENSEVFVICAQIEQEISELDDDEKAMFLEELGLSESGLEKLIKASYRILGLMSFLTAGEDETRAWTIKIGTKAPQAAGKIHSDFERGFIKAEVVNYRDLLEQGSLAAAREKGLVGMEGKEYVVRDGDVILFRFNV